MQPLKTTCIGLIILFVSFGCVFWPKPHHKMSAFAQGIVGDWESDSDRTLRIDAIGPESGQGKWNDGFNTYDYEIQHEDSGSRKIDIKLYGSLSQVITLSERGDHHLALLRDGSMIDTWYREPFRIKPSNDNRYIETKDRYRRKGAKTGIVKNRRDR